jgi:hypothetical protein
MFVCNLQEVAGVGGDVDYWKHETELQANKKLLWDSVSRSSHLYYNAVCSNFTCNVEPDTEKHKLRRSRLPNQLTCL